MGDNTIKNDTVDIDIIGADEELMAIYIEVSSTVHIEGFTYFCID